MPELRLFGGMGCESASGLANVLCFDVRFVVLHPPPELDLWVVGWLCIGPLIRCVYATDGTLWMWGWNVNANRELGDGTIVDKKSPVQVTVARCGTFSAIALGADHSAALCAGMCVPWRVLWCSSVLPPTCSASHHRSVYRTDELTDKTQGRARRLTTNSPNPMRPPLHHRPADRRTFLTRRLHPEHGAAAMAGTRAGLRTHIVRGASFNHVPSVCGDRARDILPSRGAPPIPGSGTGGGARAAGVAHGDPDAGATSVRPLAIGGAGPTTRPPPAHSSDEEPPPPGRRQLRPPAVLGRRERPQPSESSDEQLPRRLRSPPPPHLRPQPPTPSQLHGQGWVGAAASGGKPHGFKHAFTGGSTACPPPFAHPFRGSVIAPSSAPLPLPQWHAALGKGGARMELMGVLESLSVALGRSASAGTQAGRRAGPLLRLCPFPSADSAARHRGPL